jgi:phosphoserine aminotransferase
MERSRPWNFSPGPAVLPSPVLEAAARGIRELDGSGMSILEVSHRSRWFEDVIEEAEAGLRELLDVPREHRILFCPGGASLQFSMAPMNLLSRGHVAEYVVTGSWGERAAAEARRSGDVRVAWDGAGDGYVRVPSPSELDAAGLGASSAYVHFTSNETIQGVEWPNEPASLGAPLVCDMSSDFLSRPIDVRRYGIIYAGAQKNAGPAGVTIVIASDDLISCGVDGVPAMLDYRTYARHGSLYNTPPVFAVYVVMLVTRWLRDEIGGLEKIRDINAAKAALLYEAIDQSDGFYAGHAQPASRSRMNVTWRLPSEELERAFLDGAEDRGLRELRGHRSVGGLRASIYNAMPLEGVFALRDYMDEFRRSA